MARPAPRLLTVLRSENITPNMRRIILGAGDLTGFPEHHESANFKLLLPRPGQRRIVLPPQADTPADQRPIVRTYTLRHYDSARGEISVDFMMHRDHGPASEWAASARPGDQVGFAGPGTPKFVNFDADWFFFVGDMSALPAISANIEHLPPQATGYAVLEVLDAADQQSLPFPAGIQVRWVINSTPELPGTLLADTVEKQPWLPGEPAVWIAGESGAVRAIRRYMKEHRKVQRHQLYASGYWQIGMTEDVHQVAKRKEG